MWCGVYSHWLLDCCVILSVHADGQPHLGTDSGPDLLREAGLHRQLTELGWSVEETGNLAFQPPQKSDPALDPRYGLANHSYSGTFACATLAVRQFIT